MVSFDGVADSYDGARPDYPDAVFDALGPLESKVVLEGGAGTGIATRALLDRGARVVPFDIGRAVLRQAVDRSVGLPVVVADGARLPFRDACADLVCFAQSWHWLAPEHRCAEAARLLRPAGRWAGWWSHARADGAAWFDDCWSAIERSCPGTHRGQRDIDWGATLTESGLFTCAPRVDVPWTRRITVDAWLADQATHSYVSALTDAGRRRLLERLERILRAAFPTGSMDVPYETWLWIAPRI